MWKNFVYNKRCEEQHHSGHKKLYEVINLRRNRKMSFTSNSNWNIFEFYYKKSIFLAVIRYKMSFRVWLFCDFSRDSLIISQTKNLLSFILWLSFVFLWRDRKRWLSQDFSFCFTCKWDWNVWMVEGYSIKKVPVGECLRNSLVSK